MALSLYDAVVPSFRQVVGAVSGFLEKAKSHCAENQVDLAEITETRLFPDMLPFKFQVMFTALHSAEAISSVKEGLFKPPRDRQPPNDFAGLQAAIAKASSALAALTPEEVNALQGRDMIFQIGEGKLPFTGENFLFSFSQPNLYFHATTAYDILRHKGVPLGKRDFLGQLRMKAAPSA